MNANNLQAAVEPRRGDIHGRGNLTMSGLIGFCSLFFACVGHFVFMGSLLAPEELLRRGDRDGRGNLRKTPAKRLLATAAGSGDLR